MIGFNPTANRVWRLGGRARALVACAALGLAWGLFDPAARVLAADGPATQPAVHIVKAPDGCFVPDVVVDAKGVLHMVYALNRNAYYVRSADNGATFTKPVQVNSEDTVAFTMGERGPKLSVGADGSIHVVWTNCWAPGVKVFPRYSRSTDGGKTFEKMTIISPLDGPDGLTVAADGKGAVLAFWHTFKPPQNEIKSATWLHLARSKDNGATFGPAEHVAIANLSELACSMCMMRARMGGDGNVYLAFRSAVKNIRDFYVLKGPVAENKFTAARVNQDNWEIDMCPMCGPELTLGPDGRMLCAFMSRNKVYWAACDAKVAAWDLHVATPANEKDEIYPAAVADGKGGVLFLWQVGPMSTTGRATVKWAIYWIDGKFAGQQGTVGTSTSGTKATAFVGTDGQFYIVTTAKQQ